MDIQRKGYIYAIISVLLWSTVASAFKITLRYTTVLTLLFYASIVSLSILFIVLLVQGKIKDLRRYNTRDYIYSILLGFLNPFLYYMVLFKAYSLLPAQEAQALNYMWPIMVVLFSIPLLKERITIKGFLTMILSFLGVLIIITHGDLKQLSVGNLYGVILAISSAVIWGIYWILTIRDRRDEILRLFLNFSMGILFIIPITILFSSSLLPSTIPAFIGVIYIGLFEMGVTFLLWLNALKYSITTAQVSILIYLVPFLSLIFISFIVGERIEFSTIIGLIFIVIGIVMHHKILYDRGIKMSDNSK